MNRRQIINKILHDHIDVNKNEDYTNYKKLITAIEEWHESEVKKLPIHAVSSIFSLPKQKRVMFKFDDDEPMHLNSIFEGGEFIIKLKEGKIKFEKDGKTFELYVE